MAAAAGFQMVSTGGGGHAAVPHLAVAPNRAAGHVVVALQSIASRVVDPLAQVVVSVCAIHSDTEAHNIIPETVRLTGTVRALDQSVRELAAQRLDTIAKQTASAYGCTADVAYEWGYPVTVNHTAETGFAADAAEAVAGTVIRDVDPIMAGEDFSYMLEERPGAYIFLGNGDSAQCHHPAYNFNDAAIPAGCSWFVELVEKRLPTS